MTQQRLISLEVLCCDLDALMQLHSAGMIRHLRTLAQEQRLKVPEGIFRESRKRDSVIYQGLKRLDASHGVVAVFERDQRALGLLPDMERKYGQPFSVGGVSYGGFWASGRGRKTADGQLVAFAHANGWTVISNDVSVHGACLLENVQCRRWEYLVPSHRY